MAIRYYDNLIKEKFERWLPGNAALRVLKPSEATRLFETTSDDQENKALKLPLFVLSRNTDFEILKTTKDLTTFNGLVVADSEKESIEMNVIPIKVIYQLDIYTKKFDEGDEYLRNFLFKLINNPKLVIDIPYNNLPLKHTAYLRVLSQISDTSDISERSYVGQFTRWTIQLELQDAYLFNIPYKDNWKLRAESIQIATKNWEIEDEEYLKNQK